MMNKAIEIAFGNFGKVFVIVFMEFYVVINVVYDTHDKRVISDKFK